MARKALGENRFEVFADLMPKGADAQAIWDILTANEAEEEPEEQEMGAPPIFMGESALRLIFETIENTLNEQTEPYQRKVAAKHVRNRLTTKGNPVKEVPYDKNPPVARSKSAPPAGLAEGVKEGVWHHGSDGDIEGDLRALYLTPSKSLASMLGKKVYSFKIDPNANWLDVGTPEYDYISMDSLGYSQKQIQRLKQEGVDVVWNIDDFNKGFQQVYVINPEVLQKAKDDIKETSTVEEASSMAGGNVAGHVDAKRDDDGNKKQPTLIREEDDELVEETIDYLLKTLRGGN